PLCITVCTGGTKDSFPCQSNTDCTGGGTCATGPTCIGGPRHTLTCVPADSNVPTVCTGGANVGKACAVDTDCPRAVGNRPRPPRRGGHPPAPDEPRLPAAARQVPRHAAHQLRPDDRKHAEDLCQPRTERLAAERLLRLLQPRDAERRVPESSHAVYLGHRL